jgi:4-amino-4-deoxy-L-arabinose transferase-like glycosyltransferase
MPVCTAPVPTRVPRRTAAAIVVLALVVRLVAGGWWQSRLPAGRPFFFGDSQSYWQLGQRLARGESYVYEPDGARVFRTPGYPLLLAGMFRLVGTEPSVMAGRALSALLGAAAVAGTIGWASWLFDSRAGLLTGLIAALYPGAVAMGVFVLSEAAFCLLMIAQLWLWGAALRGTSQRNRIILSAAAGLAAGLATLVRPSWLLFTPFAWLVGMLFCKQQRRQQFIAGLVAMVLLVATLTPWWIRNAQVCGHFVPTTLQVGASLYDGLNPAATGASDMQFVPKFTAELQAADATQQIAADERAASFEYRLDRQLRDKSLVWARANPGRVMELAGIKLLRLWNVWPNEAELRSWPLRIITLATYVPLFLAAIWGARKFTPAGWPYALAWLPAVYLTLLHTVFVSSIRYREPAMLALAVLAAGAIAGSKAATVRDPLELHGAPQLS